MLLRHRVAYALILNDAQFDGIELAGSVGRTGGLEWVGAQQTADVVGAEGGWLSHAGLRA